MKILVTGGSGFIGQSVVDSLRGNEFYSLALLGRERPADFSGNFIKYDFSSTEPLEKEVLQGIDVVIHLAGIAVSSDMQTHFKSSDYYTVNTDATLNLARSAAAAGIKRFIFLSTTKVYGESQLDGSFISEANKFSPQDLYAGSKLKAEIGLKDIATNSSMDYVILRPPLVYGQGVKGNFNGLLRLGDSYIPLPLGSVSASRSMVYLGNLVDFIVFSINSKEVVNQDFILADEPDISIRELILDMRRINNRPKLMFPFPIIILKWLGQILKKRALVDRITEPLRFSVKKRKEITTWNQKFTVKEAVERTVDWYRKQRGEKVD